MSSSNISAMQEFSSVTASSYDAGSLASLLTEKSAEGWSVVSIVSAGTNIVAYLGRESDGSTPGADESPAIDDTTTATSETTATSDTTGGEGATPYVPGSPTVEVGTPAAETSDAATRVDETRADETPAVEEPAGWAVAPEADVSETTTDDAFTGAADQATDDDGATDVPVAAEPVAEEPAAESAAVETPAVETAAAPAAESTVPAGWYADPSGRFELRYWDGTAWTEHVSRAGQQFTDPPVA